MYGALEPQSSLPHTSNLPSSHMTTSTGQQQHAPSALQVSMGSDVHSHLPLGLVSNKLYSRQNTSLYARTSDSGLYGTKSTKMGDHLHSGNVANCTNLTSRRNQPSQPPGLEHLDLLRPFGSQKPSGAVCATVLQCIDSVQAYNCNSCVPLEYQYLVLSNSCWRQNMSHS